MADDERGRLTQRLELLERVSRELKRDIDRLRADVDRSPPTSAEPPIAPPPIPSDDVATSPRSQEPTAVDRWRDTVDLEFWLGGRGLLLLGVAALVLAVGFFVKEAIERGWIGPTIRVLLGGGVGIAAVVAGERIRAAGYRIYGLWLAAGGFAAIYLSIWAAAALYALLPTAVGFSMMVAVVAVAGALGLLRSSESFVALALVGGYLAPVLLPAEDASMLFSLGYLGVLSATGLWVAYRAGWPYLATVSIMGGALMPLLTEGAPHLHGIYLVTLVAFALLVARRREWRELSLLTVLIGWICYLPGSDVWEISGLAFASYAAALWLANLIASVGVHDWRPAGVRDLADDAAVAGEGAATLEREGWIYELSGLAVTILPPWAFYLSARSGLEDSRLAEWQGEIGLALGLFLGAFYVAQAVLGGPGRGVAGRRWRAALGLAFLIDAPAVQWSGVDLVRVWLLEGAALTLAGVRLKVVEARVAGLVAFVLATLTFWSIVDARAANDLAFISPWALTELGTIFGLLFWAFAGQRVESPRDWESSIRPIVLAFAGLLFLVWGTREIQQFWEAMGDGDRMNLARDLSISGFWMAYAVGLLAVGFGLNRPQVRWAGLIMALVAAGKVFIYDLANLAQLYRIASFVLLAVVLLALSFRYQKLRGGDDAGPPDS